MANAVPRREPGAYGKCGVVPAVAAFYGWGAAMNAITRRTALKQLAALAAGSSLAGQMGATAGMAGVQGRVPLVHVTDLYHPPQDPDDHIDLATILALPEYDLRGVVLDATRKFLLNKPEGWDIPRDPGYVPVAQLAHLTGRAIPVAAGPIDPLVNAEDTARDRPRSEQAGIELLLDILAQSAEPVTISAVGSARVLAAAYNRAPDLVRTKTRAVLFNAGMTGGTKREWNVGLDLAAYVALWRSGVPIHWFPCGTEKSAFVAVHERGTYWKATHKELFRDLPDGLRAWFCYAFAGETRGDIIRALSETGRGAVWEHVLAGERNLWATASLVLGAGRMLARTPEGWRFVAPAAATGLETWPWRMDPITASVDDAGNVTWAVTDQPTHHWLFGRKPEAYSAPMAEALNALLRGVAV